jgi:O-antigen ligase
MKKIQLDKIIDITLFFYVLSLFLFTYREGLNIISNSFAFLFIFLVFTKVTLLKKRLIFNRFIIIQMIFILLSAFSALYAVNQELAVSTTRTLVLLFLVMFSLLNYIDKPEKIEQLIEYFILSGLIASIYILINSDFENITRFGSELGNVNAVGIIIGISFILCFNKFYFYKKLKYLFYLLPMGSVIMLTGSRKALLFILISVLLITYLNNKESIGKKVKFAFITILLLILSYYLVFEVPLIYQILGKRMEKLWIFITENSTNEGSINTRSLMIKYGLELFKEKPILGYGIDNYRALFHIKFWEPRYSHNNYIELMVGLGIVGTIVYYFTNIVVLRDLFKNVKENNGRYLSYPFITIIFSYLLLGTSLVYYDSKHFSILLVIASTVYRACNNKE